MATMYQRNGRYYLNYTVNGKRVRKSVGKEVKEAEILVSQLRYKLSRGDIKLDRPEIPIDYFFAKYLENCKTRLAEGTNKRYEDVINHFRQFFTVHYPIQFISQISKGTLQEYILYRQNAKPNLKAKTINIELAVIRAALMWAADNDWIDKNPASRVKMLKTTDSKTGRALTKEEIELLLKGCENLWFEKILLTFLNTGMRLGELLNLIWDDIDFEQGIIKIQEKPFWKPKTFERDIPINQTVKHILEGLRASQRGIYVFTQEGKKIEQNVLRKKLISLAKRVGLFHLTRIHDFRHTFASNLLMKGVDIPTVQALLGHKSWSTTLIYSHQTKEHTQKAVERLEF